MTLTTTMRFLVIWVACAFAGFGIPQLFDSDVGGALASMIFGIVGFVVGPGVAFVVLRLVARRAASTDGARR